MKKIIMKIFLCIISVFLVACSTEMPSQDPTDVTEQDRGECIEGNSTVSQIIIAEKTLEELQEQVELIASTETIFPEEKKKQVAEIQQKIDDLQKMIADFKEDYSKFELSEASQ